MKTYRGTFEKYVKGVYKVSLVEEPAMEGDFLHLKKQEIQFKTVKEEERLLIGLVLEPNKLIYRKQNDEEFNVFFSKKDVKDLAYNFQKQGYQNNSTIGHRGEGIENVSFVETWTIKDPEKDKSAAYGLKYPEGSWMAMMKVDNEDVWNNYVKTGKVKGFSIDAAVKFREVKLNKVSMEDNSKVLEFLKELPNKIVSALSKKEEVKLEEVVEVKETEVKVELEVEKKEKPAKEEPKSEKVLLEEFEVRLSKSIDEVLKPMKKENDSLKLSNTEIQKEFDEMKLEFEELKKQPATKTIKSAPAQVEFSKMTNHQKLKYNDENGLR